MEARRGVIRRKLLHQVESYGSASLLKARNVIFWFADALGGTKGYTISGVFTRGQASARSLPNNKD